MSRGQAAVYERQALVLVNRGGASGAEILALAREVQDRVRHKFGIVARARADHRVAGPTKKMARKRGPSIAAIKTCVPGVGRRARLR